METFAGNGNIPYAAIRGSYVKAREFLNGVQAQEQEEKEEESEQQPTEAGTSQEKKSELALKARTQTPPLLQGAGQATVKEEYFEGKEPKPKKPKLDFQVMKANYYQELVDLKRDEDYERKTMDREIQDVLDRQKLERREFLKQQKRELEEFNGENHEALQDKQKEEMELKEISFEEERKEITKRNQSRTKAISEIHKKRKNMEDNLFQIFQQEKQNK